jgi:hypothetical protein
MLKVEPKYNANKGMGPIAAAPRRSPSGEWRVLVLNCSPEN